MMEKGRCRMGEQISRCYRVVATEDGVRGGFAEVPVEQIGTGGVLIRARYSSINYKDALAATGRAPILRNLPQNAGIDVIGVVEESDHPDVPVGSRALVTAYGLGEDVDGGYSQWVRVPSEWVVRPPEALTDIETMALGTAGLTSALAIARLEQAGLRPGRGPVAVTGASGGTGSLAVAMLARLGYEVTAFSGKDSAREMLLACGATTVEGRPPVAEQTRPLESARWAGALDSVGGETLGWLIRTLQRDASVATFGNAGGNEFASSVMPFILRAVNVLGVNTGYFDERLRRELWQRMSTDMRPNSLEALTRVVPFGDVEHWFEKFLAGQVTGRIVVEID